MPAGQSDINLQPHLGAHVEHLVPIMQKKAQEILQDKWEPNTVYFITFSSYDRCMVLTDRYNSVDVLRMDCENRLATGNIIAYFEWNSAELN